MERGEASSESKAIYLDGEGHIRALRGTVSHSDGLVTVRRGRMGNSLSPWPEFSTSSIGAIRGRRRDDRPPR